MKTIAITGAAGNLGLLTARYLLAHAACQLHLLIHKKALPPEVAHHPRVRVFTCDLVHPETIGDAFVKVDAILHYASVLFKARPERFMATTNTLFFKNVVDAAKNNNVPRVVLTSFPHVEGETSFDFPSTEIRSKTPISIHAKTRLAEENYLMEQYGQNAVILRIGMVYGRGVLMPDTARWCAQRYLLGVWKKPTHIHLISLPDYLAATKEALLQDHISGTYNLGDEGEQTLQAYLDFACKQWNAKKPWQMPDWMIYCAAYLCERFSEITGHQSPLTHDFLDIGRVSYYGDTTKMRAELLPHLKYKTMQDGAEIF